MGSESSNGDISGLRTGGRTMLLRSPGSAMERLGVSWSNRHVSRLETWQLCYAERMSRSCSEHDRLVARSDSCRLWMRLSVQAFGLFESPGRMRCHAPM